MDPAQVTEAVPVEDLDAWLRQTVPAHEGPLTVTHLSGGSSNLTFRVRDDRHDWVLRRPPHGTVLATANDMGREFRVQSGLAGTDIPVARTVALCEDSAVIGAPFYLMEYVDGVVYSDADAVAHLSDADAAAASDELIDVLARLHAVDFANGPLHDLGRPAGFLRRQIDRWSTQWERSKTRELPEIDELIRRLDRSIPAHTDSAIVHGDYSFNNTMWDRHRPHRMVAVLDWEMSTLGDPLTDLGMVVTYWGEAGALMWRNRAPQPHRRPTGFPDVDHLIARYESTRGRAVRDLDVYLVLATFKLAVITEGAMARIHALRPEEDTSAIAETVAELASMALQLASMSTSPGLRGS